MDLREAVEAEVRQAVSDCITGLYDETALVPLVAKRVMALFPGVADTARLQREAFVAGGDWYWQDQGHENGMPNMERDRCESAAARRYPEGGKK